MDKKSDRENIIWDLIEQLNIYSRLSRSYNTTARYYGSDEMLYLSEVHTIHYIGENAGINLNELAEITQRSKGATSSMVDSLIKRELVIKERDPNDSRRIMLALTKKGEAFYEHHEALDKKNYGAISEDATDLSDEDFEITYKVVKRIIDELFDKTKI